MSDNSGGGGGSGSSMPDDSLYALVSDPLFVLRLQRKILSALTEKQANGYYAPRKEFALLDRRVDTADRVIDLWTSKSFLRLLFPQQKLNEKELDAFFVLLLQESDTSVIESSAIVSCLREMLRCPSHQFQHIIHSIRAREPRPRDSAFGKRLATSCFVSDPMRGRRSAAGGGEYGSGSQSASLSAPSQDEVVAFLMASFNVTRSEAMCVVGYSRGSGYNPAANCSSGDEIDYMYLFSILYEYPLPDDIAFPLLMSKFAEGACDPARPTGGGTAALLAALQRISLIDGHGADTDSGMTISMLEDVDAGALSSKCLTCSAFMQLCEVLQTGLQTQEAEQLYCYLRRPADSCSPHLQVGDLFGHFRNYFPSVPRGEFDVVLAAVRRCIIRSGGVHGLNDLFVALVKVCGTSDRRLPISSFLAVMRQSGVAVSDVSDVQLEYLRMCGRMNIVKLMSVLQGECKPSRETLIRKVYDNLDAAGAGAVGFQAVLQRFDPMQVEAGLHRDLARWPAKLEAYFALLPGTDMSYEVFAFFWRNASASLEDDATFTMILWRCFGLHLRSNQSTASPRGLQNQQSEPNFQRRRM